MRALVLAGLLVYAPAARADGVLDEGSAGDSQATASTPRMSWIADKLAGMYEPGEDWQLRVDLTATHDWGAKPSASSSFGSSPGDIYLANVALEWDPGDWTLKLVGGYSPSSTTLTSTTVPVTTAMGTVQADAQLQSTAATTSAAAWLGWDTGILGDFNTALLATATANVFDTQQAITAVQARRGGVIDVSQIEMYCASHTCSPELLGALSAQETHLVQYVLDASVTQTLWHDSDVGLDAAYYLYNQDPTKVGYFSVAAVGRTSTFGNGPSTAPLQYTVMPNVIHRFGALMMMASFTYGRYVASEGYDTSAALRVQYRWKLGADSRLKVYGKLAVARDVDDTQQEIRSGSAALGAQYTW